MEPQSQDCGKQHDVAVLREYFKLQWSRSHKTAERAEVKSKVLTEVQLQWSRSHKTAESHDCANAFAGVPARFNGAAVTRLRKGPCDCTQANCSKLLQWSRSHKTAESEAAGAQLAEGDALQWSRSHKTAERPTNGSVAT